MSRGAIGAELPEPYRMVSVDFDMFQLIGVYMPNLLAKIPYWEALIATLSSQSANRALAIGDFNTCRAYLDFATCGGTAIRADANTPGLARVVMGFASTMPSCRRSWWLAPAPSTIPIRSGSPGSPITHR